MKLYTTYPGHFVGYTTKITAEHCGFKYENVYVAPGGEIDTDPAFIAKIAHHNFPALELEDGSIISQSIALSKYIANETGHKEFIGNNAFEAAQIDQFCSIAQSDILPVTLPIALTTFGWLVDPAKNAASIKAVKEKVKMLNDHLKDKEFLVGGRFTLADAASWSVLMMAFTLVLDGGFRKAMPHAAAWFERVSKLNDVIRVAGHVKMVEKALKPATA
jgi:glutathione S-transferase